MVTLSQSQAAWFTRYQAARPAPAPMRAARPAPLPVMPSPAPYGERAYFDGEPCQHVAAWEEAGRLARIAKRAGQVDRRAPGRPFTR